MQPQSKQGVCRHGGGAWPGEPRAVLKSSSHCYPGRASPSGAVSMVWLTNIGQISCWLEANTSLFLLHFLFTKRLVQKTQNKISKFFWEDEGLAISCQRNIKPKNIRLGLIRSNFRRKQALSEMYALNGAGCSTGKMDLQHAVDPDKSEFMTRFCYFSVV